MSNSRIDCTDRKPVITHLAWLIAALSVLFTQPAFAAPSAVDDVVAVPANTTVFANNIAANDTSVPTDTYTLTVPPSHGIATITADGLLDYTPNIGFASEDTLTYSIDDGAGGIDFATVTLDVVLTSDFLTPAASFLIGEEDVPTPLNLSVDPSLEFGGTLQDIIGVAGLYRAAGQSGVPVTATIPTGSTGIKITGYATRNVNTAEVDQYNDDYELLTINVDLRTGTHSGRLTYSKLPNLAGGTIDQYTWLDVPLGQSVLSDPGFVEGEFTGAADVTVELIAGEILISETQPLQIAYHVEFMTADGDSADFVSGSGDVQVPGDDESALAIPAELEPTDGSSRGYIVLTGNSAANGAHFREEHKGFSRVVIDLETSTVSGVVASERGEIDNRVTTWAFENYPLIDLRVTPGATPISITSSTATLVGDTAATVVGVDDDPTIYIDASGDLVIKRATGHANEFTTMYTSENYRRTDLSSIASFVGVISDTSLFDALPSDNVDGNGKPVNIQTFAIPASSSIGIIEMSWQTVGGDEVNENVGYGFAVIDLNKSSSSGSITFSRATTPDLVSWQGVPIGTTMFGATSGGVPLFQSNKLAGKFTDGYAENARFEVVNNADGSRTLEFTSSSDASTGAFADYLGTAQVSWLGSEPFRVEGVPVTGTLSHGSPTDDGGWEVDFGDIPLLSISADEHESGELQLDLLLSSTGELDTIIVHVEPVVDAPPFSASDVVGYVGNPVALAISTADSADADGSETQFESFDLSGIPTGVILSASAGTVTNFGGGNWQADAAALPTLSATSSIETTAVITVSSTNIDTNDLDGDGVIEDVNNGAGVDELDSVTYQQDFELSVRAVPTVVSQQTNTGTPVISGTADVGLNETLMVSVNGVTYIAGAGNLIDNGDGTWDLTIPSGDTIADGTYAVTATLTHTSGGSGSDTTSDELIIDATPPAIPTVNPQTTSDATPAVTGTANVAPGETLSVTLDGITYTAGDGNLMDNGDGTWTLAVSTPLVEGIFPVTAIVTDAAGNNSVDTTAGELVIEATPLQTPTVVSQTTSDTTPLITGTAMIGTGESFMVEVDGVTYSIGDGNLVYNSNGTWQLTIPTAMADATYEVLATVTDVFGNPYPDSSSDELIIDTTDPVAPMVNALITNNQTPMLTGTATLAIGELLTVSVGGVSYTDGDGQLVVNADGTWELTPVAPLAEGTYDVTATVTDAAGNSIDDSTNGELIVDLTPPVLPTVAFQTTSDTTPLISGSASVLVGDTLHVSVAGTTYTAGDGFLVDNGDGTWDLDIPTALADGDYSVTATIIDAAGNASDDATTLELTVDTSAPVTPTVASQNTNSTSPTLTGTATVAPGETLNVTVDGVTYTAGDGYLFDNGDGTWALAIPVALSEGTYDVVVTVTDFAGNSTSDTTVGELIIDLTAPIAPGVTSLATIDTTPAIEGTATVGPGETLSVEVDGVVYTEGDGNLVLNGDDTWVLTIPATNILAEALYQVVARVTDAAGNSAIDPGVDDLLVDLTAPVTPGVTSLTTNDTTPTIEGSVVFVPGETLTVTVNGITYTEGDGNLVVNGDGTWTLDIPTPTLEGLYNVTAVTTDTAGNTSTDPSSNELLIDTTLPLTPTVNPQITIDTTPTITGTANPGPGETLTVVVDGVTYSVGDGSLVDNSDGTWDLTIPAPMADGTYEVVASIVDAAGNISTDTSFDELVIDTTAPIIPTVDSLITGTPTPVLTGTTSTAPGETLTITLDGMSYTEGDGHLVVNADGTWALTVPAAQALADAIYEVVATTTDIAGNSSVDTSTQELIVDTMDPVIPTVTAQVTSNTTPVIMGSATLAAGEILMVTVDGVTYTEGDGTLVDNADGTWELSVPTALNDNTYPVTVTITDAAGNVSTDITSAELIIDTTAPVTPTVVALTTSNTTPTLNGTAIVGAGETLTLEVDGVVYTAGDGNLVDNADGTWALVIPTAMADGVYDVVATVVDAAGNSTDDATAAELTIDTVAPLTPTVIFLITNDTTPTISGSALIGAGETLSVTLNGVLYTAGDGSLIDNGDGTWDLTVAVALVEGTYEVSAAVTDAAGNVSADTTVNELVIDTTGPVVPSVTPLTTNNASPVISGTATVQPGDTLTISVDGTTYTAGDGFLQLNPDGSWDLSIPFPLAEGAYDVTATVTDVAGNATDDATSLELVIDLTAPIAPGVTSQATVDTTPVIEGTATLAPGEVLTVEVNGVIYTAGDTHLVDNADGTWALTIPASDALPEALYQVVATVTDMAGNSSTDPGVDDLLVDVTAPITPGVTSLTTNDTTPTIEGTAVVGPGEILSVVVNGVTYIAGAGSLVDNGDGTWSLTVPTPLVEGLYDVSASITDIAGNISNDPSSGELLIDTTLPLTPTVTPTYTNDITPLVSGSANAGPGETLTVTVDGVTYTAGDGDLFDNGDGTWELIIPTPMAEGTYEVLATIIDAAGNLSSDASVDELVIDITPPTAPTVNTLISDNATPTLTGTTVIVPGETLSVTVDGVTYTVGDGNLSVNPDGTWALIIPSLNAIADGNYDVVAVVTDLAGNTTNDATALELIVDTQAPVVPTVTALTTNITSPTIEGSATVAAGETLSVTVDGVIYTAGDGNLIDNGDGTWELSVPSVLSESTYPVTVIVVDAAGNSSTDVTSLELVVDTTAPVSPTVVAQITANTTPTITGTAIVGPGEFLTVTVNGLVYTAGDGDLVNNGDGSWALLIPAALLDSNYGVTATVVDAAGNSTDDATAAELTIDTVAPLTPTVTSLITNNTTPTISGTATLDPGDTLTVTVNGITYTAGNGFLIDNGDGTWELSLVAALTEGVYDVTAMVTDAAGNSTDDATALELVIDLTAPVVPSVISQITADSTPIIQGSATLEPGELLIVVVNGVVYTDGDGNLIDNGDGTWTLSVPIDLADGNYDIMATVTDAAGNVNSDVSVDELVIDLTAPLAPGVTSLTTADTTPVIEGTVTLTPGETLSVEVNGLLYTDGDGNLIDNGDGTWSLAIPASASLAEGLYQVIATVTDAAGNSALDPGVDDLLVDTTAPSFPGTTSLTTNNLSPVLTGTAVLAAGETLNVTVNGITYTAGDGNLVTNPDGTWTLTLPIALVEGVYDVTATIIDVAGNSSSDPSSQELLVDTTLPVTPDVAPVVTNDTTPIVSGTANPGPGETLTVTVDGVTYTAGDGNLVDNGDGTWDLTLPTPLAEGIYDVVATVIDAAGNISTDAGASELIIDTTAPTIPTVDASTTNNSTPVITGTATVNPGDTLTVTVDGVTYTAGDGSLVDNGDGTWTLSIPVELAEGDYDVTVTVTDPAGNSTSDTSATDFTVDTSAPAIPTVTALITADAAPVITGTATVAPGETFSVSVNGVSYTAGDGYLELNADGTWTLTLPVVLVDGTYEVVATITDVAGNLSTDTSAAELVVDTTDPVVPTVDPPQVLVQLPLDVADFDGDGISDAIDLDDDNDGIPDTDEGTRDTDGDGFPDYQDLDSDNDGIPDIVEVNGDDVDNDYTVDGFVDRDNNGLSDDLQILPFTLADFDSDGVPDFRDLDSDNDGLTDLLESGGNDVDNNGRIDDFFDANNDGADDTHQINGPFGRDTDGDGVPNRRDLDSDGDGLFDLVESGVSDLLNDGVLDSQQDVDKNGIPDSVDAGITGGDDADGDGIDDRFDISFTDGSDFDGDGIIDAADPDADGDGFADASFNTLALGQALPDLNGNGLSDVLEPIEDIVLTGLRGRGGCSVAFNPNVNADANPNANPGMGDEAIDPLLLLLLASSGACLWRRRGSRFSA